MVTRIVSGGQTGVDRAALDSARQAGIECGGWVPKGRMAEDGVIPARYANLIETASEDPKMRTELNVRDSDATLLISRGIPGGGSAFTIEVATRLGKPILKIDLERESTELAIRRVLLWLQDVQPAILNVAGGRASEDRDIYDLTKAVLEGVFLAMNSKNNMRTGLH
jgi:hypothetical protein